MHIRPSFLFAFIVAFLLCWEKFRFKAIISSGSLYAFKLYCTHFIIFFFFWGGVSCSYYLLPTTYCLLPDMAFVGAKRNFPSIRPCWGIAQVFLETLFVDRWDDRISHFHIVCEFCDEVIKSIMTFSVYIMNNTGQTI